MNRKYYLNEIWKPIKGYEGLYEISDYGRVKSLNYRKWGKPQILQIHARKGNYLKVGLVKDGRRKYYRVHRLVAIAFLPEPQEGQTQVEHLNCDTRDNRVQNLRWSSPKGNMANELTRYRLSISHLFPSAEIRQHYSEGQIKRYARERATHTGRYTRVAQYS